MPLIILQYFLLEVISYFGKDTIENTPKINQVVIVKEFSVPFTVRILLCLDNAMLDDITIY